MKVSSSLFRFHKGQFFNPEGKVFPIHHANMHAHVITTHLNHTDTVELGDY